MKTKDEVLNEVSKELTGEFWGQTTQHADSFNLNKVVQKALDVYANQFKPQHESKDLQQRRIGFFQKIGTGFLAKYERQMLIDFCEYWTEFNEGGNKMRYEMKKNQPFNVSRRLNTWKTNNKNNTFGAKKSKTHSNEDIIDAIKNQL